MEVVGEAPFGWSAERWSRAVGGVGPARRRLEARQRVSSPLEPAGLRRAVSGFSVCVAAGTVATMMMWINIVNVQVYQLLTLESWILEPALAH